MSAAVTYHRFNVKVKAFGYYIYQSGRDAAVDGEFLNCYREVGSTHNLSAVKML